MSSPIPPLHDQSGFHPSLPDLAPTVSLLCELLEISISPQALKQNLSLHDNLLTRTYLENAVAPFSIEGRLVKMPLDSITEYMLPCMLLLKTGEACILIQKTKKEAWTVLFAPSGRGEVKIQPKELRAIYDGEIFIARPLYRPSLKGLDEDLYQRNWFWQALSRSWPIYGQVIIAAMITNLFGLATPLFTMNIYDRVIPHQALETLWALSIGIISVFIFEFLLRSLRVYFIDLAGQKTDVLLSNLIMKHLTKIQFSQKPSPAGVLANQLREFEHLREFFSSATIVTLVDLPFMFFFIIMVGLMAPSLAIIPLIVIFIIVLGTFIVEFPIRKSIQKNLKENSTKHAFLLESIYGLEAIKLNNAENRILYQWESLTAHSSESSRLLKFLTAFPLNFTNFVQQIGYIGTIIVGVGLVNDNTLTTGGLIAISLLMGRIFAPLTQTTSLLTRIHQSLSSLRILNYLFSIPQEKKPDQIFTPMPRFTGATEFHHVTFGYENSIHPVLSEFSFCIKAGERIGIIGRMGCGKSTLTRLLLKLYSPSKGSIALDGIDINQIDASDVRHHIGYAPQNIHCFQGSLIENITFGKHVDWTTLNEALEISGVLDFSHHHPQGLHMPIGESGSNLSSGQKQTIGIARALIQKPTLLMLDEPSAFMDQNSEVKLTQRLQLYLKDPQKTLLLISHRLPMFHLVNRLIVMDGGQIVADGKRDDILKMLQTSQIHRQRS